MIILCTVPFSLLMAYWTNKGVGHLSTETRVRIIDLALLKPKYKRTQKLLEQVQGQAKGAGKTMVSMADQIPKKDKDEDKGGPKGNPNDSSRQSPLYTPTMWLNVLCWLSKIMTFMSMVVSLRKVLMK